MDLTRPITYRGVDVNDATAQVGKPGLVGCSVEGVSIGVIQPLQYMDKMYQNEGMDFQGVGNLMVASRMVTLSGVVYGETRGDMWDHLVALRVALDPVQSYADDQDDMGFLPLAWQEVSGATNTEVDRFVYARSGGIRDVINRDKQGTNAKVPGQEDNVALALQWACEFTCRDPRVYGDTHTIDLMTTKAGSLTNHGDYPTLVDLTLVLFGSGSVVVEVGGTTFTLVVGSGTPGRTVRYRGWTKLVTLVDSDLQGTAEILRQDMLVFETPDSDTQHPSIQPGASPWRVSPSGGVLIQAGTLVYRDAYA